MRTIVKENIVTQRLNHSQATSHSLVEPGSSTVAEERKSAIADVSIH
ncbi:protein of unknown function [Sterolibacterium denitrificans]|uniref:Uncharacterized protein n=1 Tax=Sterolibacterium denitrificans TaxID=157592 RepID=A0A7Z7HPG6_9PROT|nr:protein of unknown function [Sterolibacterium denitrificans]